MKLSLVPTIAINADMLLSLAACVVFARPSLRRDFPWVFRYLAARAVTAVITDIVLFGPAIADPSLNANVHLVLYWAGLLISTGLLFPSCLDVYRQALTPLPGLARMGNSLFTWAAVASVLVTATTLTTIGTGPGMLSKIGLQLLRCTGTTELCLLALLVIALKGIRLSWRSRPLGIAVGLAVMAAADCTQSVMASLDAGTSPGLQIALESASIVTLVLWIAYGCAPEPAKKTVAVPVNSAIYKWDQIASALGRKGTQVAVQPAPSFFLVDVEKVVERAFTRTLKGKESES